MSCKKFTKNWVKNFDIFGKPIMLNYNKKGWYFNTFLGGILSIFLNLVVIVYLIQRIIVLN